MKAVLTVVPLIKGHSQNWRDISKLNDKTAPRNGP